MPVDAQIETLLSLIASGTPMYEVSPEEASGGFRTLTVSFRKPEDLIEVGAVEDIKVAGAEGELNARVYRPS
ncbi:MAG: alpha/beta hydrolase, partial [Marmoricola sp.]